jgi:hypothetical protein
MDAEAVDASEHGRSYMSISTDTSIATRILNNFSTGSVKVRERTLTKNRVTLTTTVGSNTDTTLNAVVTNYNKGEVDGTLVLETDLKVIADSAKVIKKEDADLILIASTTYRIVNVREINPAGVVLAYEIQARL